MMDDAVSVETMSVEVTDVDVGISIGWVGDGSATRRRGVAGERGTEREMASSISSGVRGMGSITTR